MLYFRSYRKEKLKMSFAEKIGELFGRLMRVMVLNGLITERDVSFITGEISDEEWLGGKDETN